VYALVLLEPQHLTITRLAGMVRQSVCLCSCRCSPRRLEGWDGWTRHHGCGRRPRNSGGASLR